jgi:osmotically inducible lipoprotein OsmB
MKKLLILGAALLSLGLAGCETPGERAAGGAVLGAGAGALIGHAVTGRPQGAWVGAGVGGVAGAVYGASTARPQQQQQCGYDAYGRQVCYAPRPRPVRCGYDYYGRQVCYQ